MLGESCGGPAAAKPRPMRKALTILPSAEGRPDLAPPPPARFGG